MSTHPDGSPATQAAAVTPRGRRFGSFHELLRSLGATRMVSKILVANNGLAAVKGINSIRQWCFAHLDVEQAKHCIEFEVMATPEDLSVDAEFTHLAEHYVDVPGGKNIHNYANVDLIVQVALQQRCDAVYPGWGHASENPALPRDLLAKTGGRVVFLGPGETAMFSLGDKIASTIIAQSFGVPCVGWSGSHVRIPAGSPPGVVPKALHDQAFVHTLDECVAACERVGFPVMIKASEGGGGKGIRRVLRREDIAAAFEAVQAEVVDCHIFVMQMLSNVRHLEVQLLADQYGDCIAVRTRDCSVQRRHQKIIEEGPVVGVDPAVVMEMEQAAIRMAKAVGYLGLGTVEYMYDRDTGKYFFLELNPRVQVEHPVSELISGVNLPMALLLVSIGVPLHRIPEVRKYYGEQDKYGDSKIDFDALRSLPPRGHAIAVRITAEDAEEGFRPTTGAIEEITFKDSEQCWGYFSVGHGRGGIHQYADSQFGHIFAHAATREEARRAMILALSSLYVRGEIRYSTPFVVGLLQRPEFIHSEVHTAWLDGLLARHVTRPSERFIFQSLAAGAVFRLVRQNAKNADEYCKSLCAGHTPAAQYLDAHRTDTFIVENKKYTIHSGMLGPSTVALVLNGSVLQVSYRGLQSSGAMQLQLGSRNVVAHVEEEAIGCRVNFSDRTIVLTADADPTKLRASVSGKLVRYLVRNGEHIAAGAHYCEIEVMKMIYPLVCNVAGTLTLRAAPGATLQAGKLLAEIEPDDPSTVARAETDTTSQWPASLIAASARSLSTGNNVNKAESADASGASNNAGSSAAASGAASDELGRAGSPASGASPASGTDVTPTKSATTSPTLGSASESADSVGRARNAVRMLWTLMQGYHPSGPAGDAVPLAARLDAALDELSSLGIYSVTLESLVLPFISDALDAAAAAGAGAEPASAVPIRKSTSPIQKLHFVLHLLLSEFIAVETHYDGQGRATALETLRRENGGDAATTAQARKVFDIDFCHHQKHRVEVAKRLLGLLGEDRVLLIKSLDMLKQLTSLRTQQPDLASLVLQARFLLRGAQGPTFEERKNALRTQLEHGLGTSVSTMSVTMELACAVLFDTATPNTVPAILELILRRAYYGEANLSRYDVFKSQSGWRFLFTLSPVQDDLLSPAGVAAIEAAAAGKDAASAVAAATASVPGFSVSPIHKVRLADVGFGLVCMDDRELAGSIVRFADSVHSTLLPQHVPAPRDKTVYGLIFARCRSDANINELAETYKGYLNAAEGLAKLTSEVFVFYCTIIAYGAPNSPYFFTFVKQNAGAEWTPMAATPTGDASSPNLANIAMSPTVPRASSDDSPPPPTAGKANSGNASAAAAGVPGTPSAASSAGTASPTGSNKVLAPNAAVAAQQEPPQRIQFVEDRMLRNVFAPTAGRLELRRLEQHYNVNIIPQFGNRKVHLYVATPKQAVKGARGPGDTRRLFVRSFFSPADLELRSWDTITDVEAGLILSQTIAAVELASADNNFVLTKLNHMFVNLVEINVDIAGLPRLIQRLGDSFGDRLKRLRFSEVEISFRVPIFKPTTSSSAEQQQSDAAAATRQVIGTIPCRIFATNKTGYAASIALFIEVLRLDGHTELHRIQSQEDVEAFIAEKMSSLSPSAKQQQASQAQAAVHFDALQVEEGGPGESAADRAARDIKQTIAEGWGTLASSASVSNLDAFGESIGNAFDDTASGSSTTHPHRRTLSGGTGGAGNANGMTGSLSGGGPNMLNAASDEATAFRAQMLRRLSGSLPRANRAGPGERALQFLHPAASAALNKSREAPLSASEAYPPLTLTQVKRLQAQSTGTTYVFDWMTLVEVAAKQQWKKMRRARGCRSAQDEKPGVPAVPEKCVAFQQLVVSNDSSAGAAVPAPIDAKQTCGMVAWRADLLLPSRYDAATDTTAVTSVVFIANDITWENGAFSIVEDRLFAAASCYAREQKLSFVYLSSNSGARIGLATDVQARFRAALKQAAGGDASLDYLYLTAKDLQELDELGVRVVTEKIAVSASETRHKLLDVIGSAKDPIGVENLQGSALLAGQMSLNYATVPTLSVVSGRSVGIGAYLNRLGRRVVQVQGSPIILTGFQAINRLLGKDVYSSQDQLGGNDIMQPNGVSHWGPADDLGAAACTLQWLSVVAPAFEFNSVQQPQQPQSFAAPRLAQFDVDPWDRDVTFVPHVATPYDPRLLLDASSNNNNTTTSNSGAGNKSGDASVGTLGIFDRGSFVESLARWAGTVVTGRATLGGMPVGVIAVETRTVSKLDPADPADLESRSTTIKQAGQVWFPDSSRKTADAMEDFKNEGLPCFVVANWRGFSGGMRDMFDEVLKFGASIVDNLRTYDKPVIIYIPPFGELRGGSWVVVDPVINHNGCVQMYADPLARGGILEPAGIVNVKFKPADVRSLWRRSREEQVRDALTRKIEAEMQAAGGSGSGSGLTLKEQVQAQLAKVQEQEEALFTDVAVTFADLHDTPGRMLAVKCISEIVPLKDSRRYFYWRLRRMTAEVAIAKELLRAGGEQTLSAAMHAVANSIVPASAAAAAASASSSASLYERDKAAVEFLESQACAASVAQRCKASQVQTLLQALRAIGNTAEVKQIEEMINKTLLAK